VLEILKFRRLSAVRLRRQRPTVTAEEIDEATVEALETGEFQAVVGEEGAALAAGPPAPGEPPEPSARVATDARAAQDRP